MPEIQPLRPAHAPALCAFEQQNRAYFAASVRDRGGDYFARFDERLRALLAEQEAGLCFFHVLVDEGSEVLGRINLVDVADGGADLGYRIAERAAGRGIATWAVREICHLAAHRYGLTALRAATTWTMRHRGPYSPVLGSPSSARPGSPAAPVCRISAVCRTSPPGRTQRRASPVRSRDQ